MQSRTTYPGVILPIVGQALSPQLSIKKLPSQTCQQTRMMEAFSYLGFPLSSMSQANVIDKTKQNKNETQKTQATT